MGSDSKPPMLAMLELVINSIYDNQPIDSDYKYVFQLFLTILNIKFYTNHTLSIIGKENILINYGFLRNLLNAIETNNKFNVDKQLEEFFNNLQNSKKLIISNFDYQLKNLENEFFPNHAIEQKRVFVNKEQYVEYFSRIYEILDHTMSELDINFIKIDFENIKSDTEDTTDGGKYSRKKNKHKSRKHKSRKNKLRKRIIKKSRKNKLRKNKLRKNKTYKK